MEPQSCELLLLKGIYLELPQLFFPLSICLLASVLISLLACTCRDVTTKLISNEDFFSLPLKPLGSQMTSVKG